MNLNVFREIPEGFELVGVFWAERDDMGFSYSDSYLASNCASAISTALPLAQGVAYGPEDASAFFDGLLPEGSLRRGLSGVCRLDSSDVAGLLARLDNESAGGLVFRPEGEDPADNRGYLPLPFAELTALALEPGRVALEATHRTRLSLAGAQSKVGLFHKGEDMTCGWYTTQGCAPTNFIVKACDGTFPNQTINEALCMLTARNLGHDVADCHLIKIDGAEPLLAVRRYDRIESDGDFMQRLHQEDFCQALGLQRAQKYEPTDGHYANKCASLLAGVSCNSLGDRVGLFSALLFCWAIGNADNHLKNFSLLWSADWQRRELSPFYDLTCTLIYPHLEGEMSVSLCPSRRIDEVKLGDIVETARSMGVGKKAAIAEYGDLCRDFEDALRQAEAQLVGEGFDKASEIADFISRSFKERCADLEKRQMHDAFSASDRLSKGFSPSDEITHGSR